MEETPQPSREVVAYLALVSVAGLAVIVQIDLQRPHQPDLSSMASAGRADPD